MEMNIIVRSILHALSVHYRHTKAADEPAAHIHPLIHAAQQYIGSNYNRNISIQEVAGKVGLNESYFRHLFKSELSISFREYITRLRLSHVRILLLDDQHSILSAIEEVGYTNLSRFYRIFRQYYNMTPSEYRRLATGQGSSEQHKPPILKR